MFASGEPLELTASLLNSTSSPLQTTVVLARTVLLSTTGRLLHRQQCFEETFTLAQESVDAGASWSFDGVQQRARVPPSFPSFFGARGIASAHHEPVTFTYALGVVVQPPGMCASPYKVMFPM